MVDEQDEIQLTRGGQKKLGNLLVSLKDLDIAEAIRQRGGGQSQVDQLEPNITIKELVN
jgi:hypothetical protein